MEEKKPSTADILAKIRAQKASGAAAPTAPAAAATPAPSAPTPADPAAPAAPAAKPAAPAAKPGSTKDILAAIRAGGAPGSAKSTAAAPAAAAAESAPAAKPAAAKAAVSTGPLPSVQEMLKAVREGKSAAEVAAPAEAAAAKAPKVAPPMPTKPLPAGKKAVAPAPARRQLSGIVTVAAISLASVVVGAVLNSTLLIGFGVLVWATLLTPFAAAWTSISAVTGISVLGVARFMFPNVLVEPPSKFKVGPASDYPLNTVSNKWKDQFGVWVVHTDQYEGKNLLFALTSVCTHLGCTPNWLDGEQKFKCPCHGSGFYITGVNFEGPAPRPLERAGIRIAEDGMLEVDKSVKFQEEMGQWNDPTSFVQA